MVSTISTYKKSELFKEPIIGRRIFKMAEIRQLENREIAISQRKIIRF